MEWSEEQLSILDEASKKAEPAYLRMRTLAVWHVAKGRSRVEIAQVLRTTRQSVGKWVKDFRLHGLNGLRIKKGRGRKPRISHDDVSTYIYQSPNNFDIKRTRWTLELLADHVPSLKGYTPSGVYWVLKRLGIGYKRGQPHFHSPDPNYAEKKKRIEEVVDKVRKSPDRFIAFYEDEVSFYRQPTQTWLWHQMGRRQPRLKYSHRANTVMRVVGYLNPLTGAVNSWDYSEGGFW